MTDQNPFKERLKKDIESVVDVLAKLDYDPVRIGEYINSITVSDMFYHPVVLSYYLAHYDTIDWKAASVMYLKADHTEIECTIRQIHHLSGLCDEHLARGLQRLVYLRDGDV